ncbi:hypothetical protein ANRL4_01077 [Anaerolineae bacterium]|nr:hypothetical protein ANRL4_01077 [Anaerolineae bacterium]
MYLRARYYLPTLGVFPSLDPVEGIPEHASSLNRYSYVAGNTINAVDPTGLCAGAVSACALATASVIDTFILDIPACSAAFGCLAMKFGLRAVAAAIGAIGSLGQVVPGSVPQPLTDESSEDEVLRYLRDVVTSLAQARTQQLPRGGENPGCHALCPTPYESNLTLPFGGGDFDITCHLACDNGVFEAGAYLALKGAAGVGFQLLDDPYEPTKGVFLPAGSRFLTRNEPGQEFNQAALDADMQPYNDFSQFPGGLILVRQPGGPENYRGKRLGTFVEEIGHALVYHSPLCDKVDQYLDEKIAKTFKYAWVMRSGLPIGDFPGFESEMSKYRPSGIPHRRNCSGSVNKSFFTGRVGAVLEIACLDTNLLRHLV